MSNSASGSRTVQRPVVRSCMQRQRIDLQQADVLGQLVLALVQFVVGHLHALDVQVELLAGQQAFLAGQVAELEIAQLRVAQFVLQRALGLLGDVEGELEALGVEPLHLALHPGVERLVGLLARLLGAFFVQEALDLLGVLHLLPVVLQFLLGDGLADLRGAQLLEDLGDLAGGEVALEGPVLFAAGVGADLGRLAGFIGSARSAICSRNAGRRLTVARDSAAPPKLMMATNAPIG